MKVKSVHLKNFKRFTDLLIKDIPDSSRLVVVVGPNGSGKSSLFDAFFHWYRMKVGHGTSGDNRYYQKSDRDPFSWDHTVAVSTYGDKSINRGSLYIRTAYRNDPDFTVGEISRQAMPTDEVRFARLIDNDQAVSQNYRRLVYDTTSAVYDTSNDSKLVKKLREELIGDIQRSMTNVFGDLVLNHISNPLEAGAFYFEKGSSKNYHFKNLSGGEKSAFDLLLDLHIKKKYFVDAIYCVDEVETHLHTKVQGALVNEMFQIIPQQSQLWVTTHSLGVLRAAQLLEEKNPGQVSIIDFDGVNPDEPTEIMPSSLGRISWEKMLSIALDDLSQKVAPDFIVLCEGSMIGKRRKNFDAEIYNRILGRHVPGVTFVSGGSSSEVERAGIAVGQAIQQIIPATKVIALADRDDRTEREVKDWERQGNIILPERNLEAYLLADDVIRELASSLGKAEFAEAAISIKYDAIKASVARGNPRDDIKSAAGDIYVNLKKLFQITRAGNNVDAFLRDTMAPLIHPNMETYARMKEGILDRILAMRVER